MVKPRSVVSAGLYLVRLVFSLFGMWVTLGWRVRRTRKAFEKELIKQGMAKKDAKRLSEQYSRLKDKMMNGLKGFAFRAS